MATYNLASTTPSTSSIVGGDIIECTYCGAQKSVTVPPGMYIFECWGAQGGNSQYASSNTMAGGKGGYSIGQLTLTANTTVYVSAGGQGSQVTTANTNQGAGWNGGGAARSANINTYKPAGGGGASDIRIGGTGLYNRIIVAGGGGGAFNYGNYSQTADNTYAGKGGGLNGTNSTAQYYYGAYGGSQTAVGTCYYSSSVVTTNTSYLSPVPSFGTPGTPASSMQYCGGGGGGWYPGGTSYLEAGGGGSGYVYTSSTAANYPGTKPSTAYYLTSATTSDGASTQGRVGNGYVKITVKAVFNGTVTNLATTTAPTSANIHTGDAILCTACGAVKSVTLPIGDYKLECWGAQGGNAFTSNGGTMTGQGGLGGYATGILSLREATTVYLYTGSQGTRCTSNGTNQGGGWPNGGNARSSNQNAYGFAGGGGASEIRATGGTHSADASLKARIIVAGGGGGGGYWYSNGTLLNGGTGGGTSGGNGAKYSSYPTAPGGSSSAAGDLFYTSTNSVAANTSYYSSPGSFGVPPVPANSQANTSGAGGGWYPGGEAYFSAAGGGSGYVYSSSTASLYPSTHPTTLGTKFYLGSVQMQSGVQAGDGLILISVLQVYTKLSAAPTVSNVTYTGSAQGPTVTNYNSSQLTVSGTTSATLPGVYSITYSLKPGYIWPDFSLSSKTYTWQITSNWKKVQPWIYDSTM